MVCADYSNDLMEVLYGEAPPATVQRLEEHLKGCAACREEKAALEGVRRKLGAWTLPALGPVRRPSPWLLSFRGLAAAAVLVFGLGTGLGLSGTEVRWSDGHLSVRLGRSPAEVDRLLAEQKEHLTAAEASPRIPAAEKGPAVTESDLLKKVEDMIRESDERHAELVRTSLDSYSQKLETQRRLDLARMSASLSYLDGKTGQDAARTAQLVGYVLESADKR